MKSILFVVKRFNETHFFVFFSSKCVVYTHTTFVTTLHFFTSELVCFFSTPFHPLLRAPNKPIFFLLFQLKCVVYTHTTLAHTAHCFASELACSFAPVDCSRRGFFRAATRKVVSAENESHECWGDQTPYYCYWRVSVVIDRFRLLQVYLKDADRGCFVIRPSSKRNCVALSHKVRVCKQAKKTGFLVVFLV